MSTLQVSHLGKAYKQYPHRWSRLLEWVLPFCKPRHVLKWILHDINFTAEAGEAIGVLGVNGAGKSTLLKIITGTSKPTTGAIKIKGQVAAILELGMGFHSDFTGRQNVLMSGQLLGLSIKEINALMPEIEAFAELGDYIDQPLRVYSSGMSVRLAFAVATAKRPDVLIVDEALSVGDAYFQHKSFARIRSFQQQGTTLLLVSHDLAAVRGICSRVIWLEKGSIKLQGSGKEVIDAYSAALYGRQQDITGSSLLVHNASSEKKGLSHFWERDVRQDFINLSNLRNDIQVLGFNDEAERWGDGAAKIVSAVITDTEGVPFSWMIGGEEVILTIEVQALRSLENASVGFLLRDRLGQSLFGDNTFLTTIDNPRSVKVNQTLTARFRFLMPLLPRGAYTITAVVAVGSPENHVINDWMNHAIMLQSNNHSTVGGMVGIPMKEVVLEANDH